MPDELADIEAIRQLKARYFRTLDQKDWEGYREVFTDDVVVDTSRLAMVKFAQTGTWPFSVRKFSGAPVTLTVSVVAVSV